MEHCSPLCVGIPASHLLVLVSVESIASILYEASTMRLKHKVCCSHCIQVRGLCFLPSILQYCSLCSLSCPLTPPVYSRMHEFFQKPFQVKLPKYRINAHPDSFSPHFFHLWNDLPDAVLCQDFLQGFKQAVQQKKKKKRIVPNSIPWTLLPPLTFPHPTIRLAGLFPPLITFLSSYLFTPFVFVPLSVLPCFSMSLAHVKEKKIET